MQLESQNTQHTSGSTAPRVTIVIVTYQSSGTIEATLAPLRKPCEQGLLKCVAVDNASTDRTVEMLRGEAGWLEVIESGRNIGYGGGCNLGWPSATTPYVLFLNPDAVLEPSALEILVDFMEAHPRAGIVAPSLLGRNGEPHRAGGLITPKRTIRGGLGLTVEERKRIEPGGAPFPTSWLSGAVQLVRTPLLRELGGFDPRFFMYFEETDLGSRARQAGWELWAVGDAIGQHSGGESARASGQQLMNNAIGDYFFPSRFYYWVKHHGWALAVAAESVDVVVSLVRAVARWAGGRDPSPRLARLNAPIFRFPEQPIPVRLAGAPVSEAMRGARVRNAREADEPEMVDLLSRAFRRWPAFEIQVPPLEHLRWKMRSDPISSRHQWVTEFDGKIVAMIGRVFRTVRVRGRDYLVREGVDAAVDPQYREGGLYGAMLDQIRDSPQQADFDLGCGYGTNPILLERRRRKGRKAVGNPIQVLWKPYRPRAIVARRRENYGGRLPAPLAVLRIELEKAFHRLGHPPYRDRARCDGSIATLERFDDRIEGFFDEAARPFDFVVVRTSDYMNWRYCDPAAGRFTVRAVEERGRLLGILVFKITDGEGCIAELLALPGRTDVVRSLIEDALRLLGEAGVERVTCWMISRHPYNGILRRYGFINSTRDPGFSCRTNDPDSTVLEFLDDPNARIHLTLGDSDWI